MILLFIGSLYLVHMGLRRRRPRERDAQRAHGLTLLTDITTFQIRIAHGEWRGQYCVMQNPYRTNCQTSGYFPAKKGQNEWSDQPEATRNVQKLDEKLHMVLMRIWPEQRSGYVAAVLCCARGMLSANGVSAIASAAHAWRREAQRTMRTAWPTACVFCFSASLGFCVCVTQSWRWHRFSNKRTGVWCIYIYSIAIVLAGSAGERLRLATLTIRGDINCVSGHTRHCVFDHWWCHWMSVCFSQSSLSTPRLASYFRVAKLLGWTVWRRRPRQRRRRRQ